MQRRQFAFALCLLPSAGLAQSKIDAWPARSVRVVCPFAAGGSQDALARRMATKLSEFLGQQFIVDNRGGAGGTISYDNVAKSAPDGYTLLLGGLSSHALVEHLYSNLTFNPGTDLEVAAWVGTQPALLCCHPDHSHATIAGLGAASIGTSPTLALEVFKQKARISLTLISYRGLAAAAADVVAGHVPWSSPPSIR
jgi:tripartite-type tricarboxylate transporter receptor subunit TctC